MSRSHWHRTAVAFAAARGVEHPATTEAPQALPGLRLSAANPSDVTQPALFPDTCAGEARFGQLGSGVRPISHHRPVPTPQPQSVAGDNSWAFISLGSFHAAAITSQGKLYTWGLNSQGQCGVVEPDPAERGRVTYYPGPARVKSSTTGGTYK